MDDCKRLKAYLGTVTRRKREMEALVEIIEIKYNLKREDLSIKEFTYRVEQYIEAGKEEVARLEKLEPPF